MSHYTTCSCSSSLAIPTWPNVFSQGRTIKVCQFCRHFTFFLKCSPFFNVSGLEWSYKNTGWQKLQSYPFTTAWPLLCILKDNKLPRLCFLSVKSCPSAGCSVWAQPQSALQGAGAEGACNFTQKWDLHIKISEASFINLYVFILLYKCRCDLFFK